MPADNLLDQRFDALATSARPTLLRFARNHASRDYAEDLVQSALCSAWENRHRWTTEPTPKSFVIWVIRILDHLCREYLRRKSARGELVLPTLIVLSISDYLPRTGCDLTDLDYADWSALVSSLNYAIDHTPLTPRQRTCIECWLAGWSQRQIAQHLEISQTTIAEHIQAAERNLYAWTVAEIPPFAFSFFVECARQHIYRAPSHTKRALARWKHKKLEETE